MVEPDSPRPPTSAGDVDRTHRTGLVTILFTDMVGSTALKQRLGDRASSSFFDQHHEIVRHTLRQFSGGQEIETAGDSFLITFSAPSDAVQFALLLQARLGAFSAEQNTGALDRIGIYVGEVVIKENQTSAKPRDLFGIPIDTCARIMSLATGGQTLMSRFAFDAARPMLRGDQFGALQWLNHGLYQLKGIDEPIEVCEVRPAGSATSPPTSSDKASRLSTEGDLVLGWRPALDQFVPATRWKLIAKLGEGGFGEVWLGQDGVLKEKRVFKFCFKAELVRSLKRELTLFRILKEKVGEHPNIASIRQFNFETAPFYIEMDYVPGHDLKAWCESQGGPSKIPEPDKLEVVAQIADALQAAHQCGIVHRDVKPGNILISNSKPLAAKLTDFGIGQVLSEEYLAGTTRAGFTQTIMGSSSSGTGTQMYMAPEILAGKSASTRSDIYSLGVVLYQLLIGDFSRAVTIDWARRIEDPLLREDFEKCLAGDPEERFGSAAELARNLRNLPERRAELEQRQAELAQREQAAYRRGVMRTMGLAAVIVALVACLAVVAFYQSRQASQSARAEKESRQQARRLLYASDMNLAQQSLKLNNLGKTSRLLERHRPKPDEEDLRGWEWRYLWQLTRSSALATLTNRPTTRGWSVSFSADGSRLASGWLDGRVDLWDVPSRRLIRSLTDRAQPHQGQVAFSPVRNLLVATSEPKVVTLYDLDSGGESIFWRATNQGNWKVRGLAFSPDGSRLVIYARSGDSELGDEVSVVNVSSSRIESRHKTISSGSLHGFLGAAQLSSDNRRLYLTRQHSILCLDLTTGQELWETEREQDYGLATFAISPDGKTLASSSGYEHFTIRIGDAATGRMLFQLVGHTGWVDKLVFSKDGRHLISASTDQTIRFWDTSAWNVTKVLRGHTNEVHAVAISEPAQLVASASKDGNLTLWREDGKNATDGYRRLPDNLDQVLPLDHSRVLLLPAGKPPELMDLKLAAAPRLLPELGSNNVLGWFGSNLLLSGNASNQNQILVREWRGPEFISRGAIALNSSAHPSGVAYNPTRQLLAWSEGTNSTFIHIASLATPNRRVELKSDVPGLVPLLFSEDGNYLAARSQDTLRVWKIETGQTVASLGENITEAAFAAGGRALVALIEKGKELELGFFDLAHPGQLPRRFPGIFHLTRPAVSPDGTLVAAIDNGQVRLFDPVRGEALEPPLHGHLNPVYAVAFSPDGQRLISAASAREAVKLWDVSTRHELLTLNGAGSILMGAKWTADGNVILVGPTWQAWTAPSWEEIAADEAKEAGNARR